MSLKFLPFFCKAEQPEQALRWRMRNLNIQRQGSKELAFSMSDCEFPESWSQLACEIAASKYFRKSGVPGAGHESSLKQVVDRIVDSIAASGEEQNYFASRKDADIFSKELKSLLFGQKAAFNSPVWFNCGLFQKYGIEGSSGNFFFDRKKGEVCAAANAYENPQSSACFIQSVDDDLQSIFTLAMQEAKIFKYGSGSGTNFSRLRGKMEALSGGGSSSGLISFLEVLDKGAGATKSGGITRRAAKMVCLDADHPEIRDFVAWKLGEEKKVKALVAAGFSGDFEGEAYRTVSGQNSNNSVRLNDAFMLAVERDLNWKTIARTSGAVISEFPARDLWLEICSSAWNCADPGVQFSSNIDRWHTCPVSGPIRASNPCSEYMFLDDSACNLASINLLQFLTEDSEFDCDAFLRCVRLLIVAQDILVDFSSYPTEKICANSHQFRPLGLGYCGMGALLMRMGLPYDSRQGRAWAAGLTSLMHAMAYLTSAELAETQGAFSGYRPNQSAMLNVLQMHAHAESVRDKTELPAELNTLTNRLWQDCLAKASQSGVRNSQVTAIAPTGTIGLLMDSDTTGIEPEFSLQKTKSLAGGGQVSMVSQSVDMALKHLGYTNEQRDQILNYVMGHKDSPGKGTLYGAPAFRPEHLTVFDCAQAPEQASDRFISAKGHIEMLAAVQPFVSGAISKTVNMPSQASIQDVADVYMLAWKTGVKSVTIYRDRSKLSQPLRNSNQSFPVCGFCGFTTTLEGGCYICKNCGNSIGCS